MTTSTNVDSLMGRLSEGDQSAAAEIFHRYSWQLIDLARARMNWRLKRKLDPEDVVQSAFRSFFRLQAEDALHFDNWESLWGLLSLLTIRKCGHRLEYFRAACRNVDQEKSAVLNVELNDQSRASWEAVANDPTPSDAAVMTETIEMFLSQLDERDRQIFALCLQGNSIPEISEQVSRSERTIRRVLQKVEESLEELCEIGQ